jgi:hypothetical protein
MRYLPWSVERFSWEALKISSLEYLVLHHIKEGKKMKNKENNHVVFAMQQLTVEEFWRMGITSPCRTFPLNILKIFPTNFNFYLTVRPEYV